MVRRLLDISEDMRVESIVAIGMKIETRKPFDESRLEWEKVHIGRFGQTE